MAKEDCEALEKQGVKLSFDDIIRLNELGLRVERNPNSSSLCSMPRCAFLKAGKEDEHIVVLREPTIGQTLWYEDMTRLFDEEDAATYFLLHAYSLSTENLPDWKDVKKVKSELKKFVKDRLKPFTVSQIVNAVNYCLEGNSPSEGVYPDFPEDVMLNGDDIDSPPSPVEVGFIRDAQALGLGISLQDVMKMTKSELVSILDRSGEIQGGEEGMKESRKNLKNKASADYYRTLHNY